MEWIVLPIVCSLVISVIYFAHKTKEDDIKQSKNNTMEQELQELIDRLEKEIKDNNADLSIWKNYYEHNKELGEPSACFNGNVNSLNFCNPWDCPEISYNKEDIFKEESYEKRISNALSLLANLETKRCYDICNSAIFFGESKIVMINLSTYSPKDIVSVRSRKNNDDDTVTFTITINNILDPTETITIAAHKAEEFRSTMTVFRKLK